MSHTLSNEQLRQYAARASLTVAFTLIVAKLGAFLLTDSVALLSSLVDSSTDMLASIVTLWGVSRAQRPPDLQHRFGYGKAEPLAALAQAAFITGSALLLCYEALGRLYRPAPLLQPDIAYAVMALSIVLTTALIVFQHYVIRRTNSLAIGADHLHYKGDLFTNGAVIVALWLSEFTGNSIWDPVFALGVAAILLYGARGIAREALAILLDKEIANSDRERIEAVVKSHPQTRGLHDLRTRSDGDRMFIEFHLELDGQLTLTAAHHIADQIEVTLRQKFQGAEILIHQEPAGLDDERLDHKLEQI